MTIMVANMDTAVDFYTKVLGFRLKSRYGNHWASVEGPDLNIGLHPKSDQIKVGDNLQIGLRVTDMEKAVEDLSKKGIYFQIKDDVQVKLALFKDPDGNVFYLSESEG